MADHGSESDIDEDDFGHDVTPVAVLRTIIVITSLVIIKINN